MPIPLFLKTLKTLITLKIFLCCYCKDVYKTYDILR